MCEMCMFFNFKKTNNCVDFIEEEDDQAGVCLCMYVWVNCGGLILTSQIILLVFLRKKMIRCMCVCL